MTIRDGNGQLEEVCRFDQGAGCRNAVRHFQGECCSIRDGKNIAAFAANGCKEPIVPDAANCTDASYYEIAKILNNLMGFERGLGGIKSGSLSVFS